MHPIWEEKTSVSLSAHSYLVMRCMNLLGDLITSHILELDWTLPPSSLSILISMHHILIQPWLQSQLS